MPTISTSSQSIGALLVIVLLVACAPQPAANPTPTHSSVVRFPLVPANPPTSAATATTDDATSTPAPEPSAPPAPSATPLVDELAMLAEMQRLPKDRVLLARALSENRDAPEVARTEPLDVQTGHIKEFWVNNIVDSQNYRVNAELRYAGPVVLMYVEEGVQVDQAALEQSARTFENEIYPRTRDLFGSEWQPGVDGDPRIVVLNMGNMGGGVIGYFSPRDSVPASVNRFSNEHEMFYMNVGALTPGTAAYLDTLSHEFQHMIHWNEQRRSSTWFNEGSSTLSQDLNGFVGNVYVSSFVSRPDTQLTAWGEFPGDSLAHYGAAHLFMRYIYAHYANQNDGLQTLIQNDAGNHLQAFVDLAQQQRPDLGSFSELFTEWALANLLNDPTIDQGQYGYNPDVLGYVALPTTVTAEDIPFGELTADVSQFGADYYRLPVGATTLTFEGSSLVSLAGAPEQQGYAWWSGRGDNSVAALTHPFDLSNVQSATLQFDMWHEIELGYDYAFISISTDGGTTWETLPGQYTTTDDPHGANFGYGMTGVSGKPGITTGTGERGQWVQERIDLSPYTGQEVLIRFWQVTDEGFNAAGLLVDNVRIPELGFSDDTEAGTGEWDSEGFVRVDGDLPQQWEVRLVRRSANGNINIIPLNVGSDGRVSVTLAGDSESLLMVAATTPYTTERGTYRLVVQ
ncbi:MAG: hypothetical protein HC876_14755 [Chloroflexaceae bacterium]|nr:hypothetical protein [Chloroflexaceae bacterium]